MSFIMIIDDSVTVRKIVEVALRREGYQVVSFVDGIAALRWLTSPQTQIPALIFLDITLPKMDGHQIARHLKKKPAFASVPIVMLTRHNGLIDRFKARLSGASHFVTKPVTTETLLKLAQQYISTPTQVSLGGRSAL